MLTLVYRSGQGACDVSRNSSSSSSNNNPPMKITQPFLNMRQDNGTDFDELGDDEERGIRKNPRRRNKKKDIFYPLVAAKQKQKTSKTNQML